MSSRGNVSRCPGPQRAPVSPRNFAHGFFKNCIVKKVFLLNHKREYTINFSDYVEEFAGTNIISKFKNAISKTKIFLMSRIYGYVSM